MKHYRVDKMKRITLLEAPRLGQERMARFDPAVYTRRLFGMYGGQPVRVTLEGENEMVGVLIDRFGKEVPVLPVDGAHFQAFVDVAVSPQFLGWVAGLGGGLRIVSPGAGGAEDAGTGAASGGAVLCAGWGQDICMTVF